MKHIPGLRRLGILVCGAVFLLSGGMLLFNHVKAGREQQAFRLLAQQVQAQGQGQAAQDGTFETSPYAALAGQNPDLCGWVSIADTPVDYPVMHTPDRPQHYLRRDFAGGWALAGTPFLDARCDMESSPLLLVYGHNMDDGSMFAALQGYLDEAYCALHPVIRCDSLTQAREYEVMAAVRFAATEENADAYCAVPQSEEAFAAYLDRVRQNAVYCRGGEVRWGRQLLALVTCDSADSSTRILVLARQIEHGDA